MPIIPTAVSSDTDDVVWALQTAATLWERNDYKEALVWIRRAAQSASDAEQDERALELARVAADIAEQLRPSIAAPQPSAFASEPIPQDLDPLRQTAVGAAPSVLPEQSDRPADPTETEPPAASVTEVALPNLAARLAAAAPLDATDGSSAPAQPSDPAEPRWQILSEPDLLEDDESPLPAPSRSRAPSLVELEAEPVTAEIPRRFPKLSRSRVPPPISDLPTEEITQTYTKPSALAPPPPSAPREPLSSRLPFDKAPPPPHLPPPKVFGPHAERETDESFADDEVITSAPPWKAIGKPRTPSSLPDAPARVPSPKSRPDAIDSRPFLDAVSVESAAKPAAPPPPKAAKSARPATSAPRPSTRAATTRRAPPPPPPPPPPVKASEPVAGATATASTTKSVPGSRPLARSSSGQPTSRARRTTRDRPHPLELVEPLEPASRRPGETAPVPLAEEEVLPAPPADAPVAAPPAVPQASPSRDAIAPPPVQAPAEGSEDAATSDDQYPDLASHESFLDMPTDTRAAFERQAKTVRLLSDEEVSDFGLALVMHGEVGVLSLIAETPAAVLGPSDVLRRRGTIDDPVGLRLVCLSEDARVATWSEEQITQALAALPWVEEELRAAADRAHAQVAVTLGPLGEKVDSPLLYDLFEQLEVRVLLPDEVLLKAGDRHPGLLISCVGDLVVEGEEGQQVRLDPGSLVFPGALLSSDDVPMGVRAGARGAMVLQANRARTDELMIVFPPLLELIGQLAD